MAHAGESTAHLGSRSRSGLCGMAALALTGFAGELDHDIPPPNTKGAGDISVHGIFASFGMLGVF
jgi:hypothetical protein